MRSKSFDETCSDHSLSSYDKKRCSSERAANDDAPGTKGHVSQCTVVSVYHVSIAGMTCTVTVTWCKCLINHSLTVSVERPAGGGGSLSHSFKVELKPWPFWGKKGFKSLDVGGRRVDMFWDLRSAKFSNGPEPLGGYYVAMVCYEEVVMVLGDCKKEAYKRTKSRPSLVDATLVSKRENVFGKKCFSTRARFDERRKDHDIVVENSIAGMKDPEMWISIDGIVLIHVSNLQWKFRGNETVMVEKMPVQVFWDVHDWLFSNPGAGHALFIFKPGGLVEQELEEDVQGKARSRALVNDSSQMQDFCFFLYAWKME